MKKTLIVETGGAVMALPCVNVDEKYRKGGGGCIPMRGTVVYINHPRRWCTVLFRCPGGCFREAFPLEEVRPCR